MSDPAPSTEDVERRLDDAAEHMRQGHAVYVPDLLMDAKVLIRILAAERDRLAGVLADLRAGTLVIVPHDPTEAMLDAAQDEQVGCRMPTQREARDIYKAMLAAAEKERGDG